MCFNKEIEVFEIDKTKEKILKNLVSMYLHDLSEFADDLEVNEDGYFEYGGLEYYFKEKELIPNLIYVKGKLAGFVLLNSGKYVGKEAEFSIHELFVLKAFRSKGVATIAVKNILNKYKGRYRVEQLEENKLAVEFWKRFYLKQGIEYKNETQVIDGFKCFVQVFDYK